MADASQNKEEKHSSVTFSHSPHTINKEEKHTSDKFSHSPHTINKRNIPVSSFHIHLTQSTRETYQCWHFHIHLTQPTDTLSTSYLLLEVSGRHKVGQNETLDKHT